MTFRSVILGLFTAALVVGAHVCRKVYWPLPLEFYTHLPLGVYALLMMLVLGANPVLYRIRPAWRLRGTELAVILGMALVSVHIVGSGLMFHVPQMLAMPLQLNLTNPAWRHFELMSYVPPAMLVNNGQYSERVLGGLFQGLGRPEHPIGLLDVPWSAWQTTLTYWLTIIGLMGIASIALGLIVHRQWSRHERLRYPIAEFSASLISQTPGRLLGPIYRRKAFWIGVGVMGGIGLLNYLHSWFPELLPRIPMYFDMSAVVEKFPALGRAFVPQFIQRPIIRPAAMAFTYLLTLEVGFSLWSSHVAYGLAKLFMWNVGISTASSYLLGGWDASVRFGAFVGTAAILLYTGRRYYSQVVRAALGFARVDDDIDPAAGGALRVVMVTSVIVIAMLVAQRLDWPLAIASVLMLHVISVVVSRMSAEAGLFAIRAGWMPIGVLFGLMGGEALGPEQLLILGLLSMVLSVGTAEAIMPFVVNALQVGDSVGVSPRKLSRGLVAGLIVAMVVGITVGLWAYYNFGLPGFDWVNSILPQMVFYAPEQQARGLELTGRLAESLNYSPIERLLHMSPSPRFTTWTLIGLSGVLGLGFLRLRKSWWPLHPIFLLVWGSWWMGVYCFSVLIGWLIKSAVMKLGGAELYQAGKPLMIGLIVGEVTTTAIRLIVSLIYYPIVY